ncbi:MAG: 6,7-dimethyl-8-ribityllumazine synthase [Deltaproteobacteria bacterium]|nr:6,7-dimethyl-8-ribityllumazine synthase [Deltaproteobacteria bacterium]
MKTLEGKLDATGLRFAVVVSQFNRHITGKLLEGACVVLMKAGAREEDITVVKVPGAFEIPLAAKKLALSKKCDAILALGCLLRGGTQHFEQVCNGTTTALQQVMLETGIPISFGILMADAAEQAVERSGGKMGNRSEETARAAIEMAYLLKQLGRGEE